LKNALTTAQESAAVQILLEAGLSQQAGGHVREVKLICSYLHETFINDPNLAKLVHFQGYPLDLLPITVKGVPSMHICLDFAPELLRQSDMDKQAFTIDLISHLSVQYALPKSFSTARLAVNVLSTLLSVLTSEERQQLFPPVLPAFVRFCKAFPPLMEDVVSLLLQYGRICASEASRRPLTVEGLTSNGSGSASSTFNRSPRHTTDLVNGFDDHHGHPLEEDQEATKLNGLAGTGGYGSCGSGGALSGGGSLSRLPQEVQETFAAILRESILDRRLY